MIHTSKNQLAAICRQRGYTLEQVQPCIVSAEGNKITVDETHPAYPSVPKPGLSSETKISPNPQTPISGVGTELKKLLGKIGIKATPNCSCNKKALLMDTNGIEWCENNIDTIVGWLKEEATKRGLPFIDMAGRILVKKAIKNAKKT
jgi:hypothetical protein